MTQADSVPAFRFKQRARFAGRWEHEVWENGRHYQVIVGDNSHRHLRDWMSGLTDEQYLRDVVGRENLISCLNQSAPSAALVYAFNAWRQELYTERLNRLCSQPERYGVFEQDDAVREPYPIVHAARYEPGIGWVRT
ncbi:hypothetical protein ABIC11_004288 [Pseudomonas oryzihabitans]